MPRHALALLLSFFAASALSVAPCLAEKLEVIRAEAPAPDAHEPTPSPGPKQAAGQKPSPAPLPTSIPAPTPQKPTREFVFHLTDDKGRAVAWTAQGPKDAADATLPWREGDGGLHGRETPISLTSPDGAFLFRFDEKNRLLARDLKTDHEAVAELPANFPLTWSQVDGMTYDSRRRLLIVTASDGSGKHLYRFDAGTGQWLDCRFLGLLHHIAPVYDPTADRHVAWPGNGELLFLSPEGERLFGKRVADKLPGFELLPFLRENAYSPRDPVAVFPQGDDIILVAFDDKRRVLAIWLYDLKNDRAELTCWAGPKTVLRPANAPASGRGRQVFLTHTDDQGKTQVTPMPEEPVFGPAIPAQYLPAAGELPEIAREAPPRHWAEGAEIIVVSGYKSERNRLRRVVGAVRARIDRPGKKALLVLVAHDRVLWQVEATPGTTISGILVAGRERPRLDTDIQAPVLRVELPVVTDSESAECLALLTRLEAWFGTDRIHVFRGAYTMPEEIVINRPDPPDANLTLDGPAPQKPERDWDFVLMTQDGRPAAWRLSGPMHPEDATVRYAEEQPPQATATEPRFILKSSPKQLWSERATPLPSGPRRLLVQGDRPLPWRLELDLGAEADQPLLIGEKELTRPAPAAPEVGATRRGRPTVLRFPDAARRMSLRVAEAGPEQDIAVFAPTPGEREYRLTPTHLVVEERDARFDLKTLPSHFPPIRSGEFSGPVHDAKRGLLALINQDNLYRFDLRNGQWLDVRRLGDWDSGFRGLRFDAEADRYVCYQEGDAKPQKLQVGHTTIRFVNPRAVVKAITLFFIGAEGDEMNHRTLALPGLARLRDGSRLPELVLLPRGDDIALILLRRGMVQAVWRHDVKTGEVALTYWAKQGRNDAEASGT